MKKISLAKKIAACAAAACMAFGVFGSGAPEIIPSLGIDAGAEYVIAEGTIGSLSWIIGNLGTLQISGTGAMEDYADSADSPFYGGEYAELVERVFLKPGITSIGDYAFYGLQNLETVTIPDTVTRIGNDAFAYCTALESITVPEGVRYIGSAAFSSTGLRSLTVPDSVEEIAQYAVTACENLSDVFLPAGLERIGKGAFAYNDALGDVWYDGSESEWDELFRQYDLYFKQDIDDYLFLKESVMIHYDYSESGDDTDPGSVTYITGGGISASATDVAPSGTFTVYIDIPKCEHDADTVSFRATFDPTVFEVVSWYSNDESDSRYAGNYISGSMANYGSGFFSLSATNAKHSIDLSSGIRLTATMKVRSTASAGSHSIDITRSSISYVADGGQENIELWDPDNKHVSINVTAGRISGTVTGYGDNEGTVTVRLLDKNRTVLDTVYTTDGNYAFDNVQTGQNYIITVSMPRCVTDEISVTPSASSTVKNLTLRRYGDVNGDGYVDSKDAVQILLYDVGKPSLIRGSDGIVNEYLLSVAKVCGNSTLTAKDATQILRYSAHLTSVFNIMD